MPQNPNPRRKSDAARRANQVVRSRTVLIMLALGVVTFAASCSGGSMTCRSAAMQSFRKRRWGSRPAAPW